MKPKAYLTRRYWFAASHRLHCNDFSDEQNREVYGKCNNPHGHGHNYALEVTVSGPVDPISGMICNLVNLDSCVHSKVIDKFDHENLNTLPEFEQLVPTSENLAEQIFHILRRDFRAAHLEKVRLEETMLNSFEYAGGSEIRH
jgi:6-pyruvoyltetrahydropterin/6-carboxytetrahydropterin synthase